MIKTTFGIDGMVCGMCENHVCDAVRNAVPGAKKVSASRRKGEVVFLTEYAADTAAVAAAIEKTGYRITSVRSDPVSARRLFHK